MRVGNRVRVVGSRSHPKEARAVWSGKGKGKGKGSVSVILGWDTASCKSSAKPEERHAVLEFSFPYIISSTSRTGLTLHKVCGTAVTQTAG